MKRLAVAHDEVIAAAVPLGGDHPSLCVLVMNKNTHVVRMVWYQEEEMSETLKALHPIGVEMWMALFMAIPTDHEAQP